ncbi:hypothetical protein GO988_18985 [Hymenobacter sp. HMF4947]|uniref:DUF1795 domain-containing protein n=1 Tax=Hymenobacter ginkgonis TaxID=2682976 RepID=A0A7K1TJQ2_9BACT|nr:hypothetical protein [Hymenobacter ginkgonis]MVN78421.1 hypothetical protein [Hymenobacter ginkgonis]
MKTLPLLCALLALTSFGPKPKLTSTKLAPGLTVGVPQGFTPLPDEGIAMKFPSPRKPLAVFSSPNGRTDYSVSVRPTTFGPDYNVLLPMYKASVQRLYTKVEFLTQEVRKVNGRDFVALEFISTLNDSRRAAALAPLKKYEFIEYAVQGEQLYIFSFSAPAEEQAQWRPVAQAALSDISLK